MKFIHLSNMTEKYYSLFNEIYPIHDSNLFILVSIEIFLSRSFSPHFLLCVFQFICISYNSFNLYLSLYTHTQTHTHIYIYIYIYMYVHQSIDIMVRVFANDPGTQGSIPGQKLPNTQKWYLIPSCLTFCIIRYRSRVNVAI